MTLNLGGLKNRGLPCSKHTLGQVLGVPAKELEPAGENYCCLVARALLGDAGEIASMPEAWNQLSVTSTYMSPVKNKCYD